MNTKWMAVILSGSLMTMGTACQEDEIETPDRFNELYVVWESKSLPYDDSWQQLNPRSIEEIGNDVVLYNQDQSYIIVDNEGNKMTGEEYKRNEESPHSISDEFVEKIKNQPLFIVKEGRYYVTTAEKEIIALFEEK